MFSVLSFVMQLELLPEDMDSTFSDVLRTLCPGPGNWVTPNDLCNLESAFGFRTEFSDPWLVDHACKLRVCSTVATDCEERANKLKFLQLEYGRRPFGNWHSKAYVSVLAGSKQMLAQHGITTEAVLRRCSSHSHSPTIPADFQQVAHQMVELKIGRLYQRENRIRTKLSTLGVNILPGYLERKVLRVLHAVAERCPPRIFAVVFKTYWNGWVTTTRCKALFLKTGQTSCRCLLGCGWDEDGMGHYILCNAYWSFLRAPRPRGLGIGLQIPRAKESALILSDSIGADDRIRLALALYALFTCVNMTRFGAMPAETNYNTLLRLLAKRGARGSPSSALLY